MLRRLNRLLLQWLSLSHLFLAHHLNLTSSAKIDHKRRVLSQTTSGTFIFHTHFDYYTRHEQKKKKNRHSHFAYHRVKLY